MQSQFPPEIYDRIERTGVIAVLVIDEIEHGPPLAEALLAGDVDAMELTESSKRELGGENPRQLQGCKVRGKVQVFAILARSAQPKTEKTNSRRCDFFRASETSEARAL